MKNNINSLRGLLYNFMIILYFAHNLLPAFGFYMPAIVYLGLFAILFLMSARVHHKDIKMIVPIVLVSIMECFDCLIGVKKSSVTTAIYGELQTMLFMLIIFKYAKSNRGIELRRLFNLIIGMYVITAITSIVGWTTNPEASRLLALGADTDVYSTYTKLNIGGFSFVYEMVLLTPLFIAMIKNNKINKIVGAILIVLSGIVAVNSQYTTAMIIYFLTLVLLLPIRFTPCKLVFIGILGLLGINFLSNALSHLIFVAVDKIDSSIVAERLNYIAEILAGNNNAESIAMETRFYTYERPLSAFIESYGIGTWSAYGSGGHSFVFDNLGCYGFFGGIVVIVFWKGVYKMSIKPFEKSDCYGYMIWGFLMAIIMMILNPKTNIFYLGVILLLFGLVNGKSENEYAVENGVK